MKKTPVYYSALIILIPVLNTLISCTPESCLEETEAFVKASFYKNGTSILRAPDSLTIYGLNAGDSILYKKALNVQTALLPLNTSTGISGFVMKINDITDTIVIRYSSYPHMISKECGLTFYHLLDSTIFFAGTAVDTIILRNRNITTINVENISIFY
jgi:hypothetical protein